MIPDHPIDTKALRKLADAATPGPWTVDHGSDWDLDGSQVPQSSVRRPDRVAITWDDHGGEVFVPADAAFIAASREAVPALLDENAALRKQVEDGRTHRRYLIGKLKGANHRADNHKARAEQAEARIKAVRGMHQSGRLGEVWGRSVSYPDDHPVCEHCTDPDADGFVRWPCPTICALGGDA